MKIVQVNIADLKEAEYNPRKLSTDQFEQIKTSLTRFGFVDPIVVNKDNTIIGGHQRVKVWKAMGNTIVPVFYVDLDKAQEKELNLRLNKNVGEFDWGKLENFFDFDELRAVGFTDRELNVNIRPKKHIGEDDVPSASPTGAKRGDIFQLGPHRIMCGDATNPADIELLMGGKRADLVFTDPPYNVDYSGRGKKTSKKIENDNLTNKEFIQFLNKAFASYTTMLKDNGLLYCCYASSTHREFEDTLNQAGFDVRNQIIWVKMVASMGWGDYRWKHEPILYCVRRGQKSDFYGDRKQYTTWDEEKTDEELLAMVKKMIEKDEDGNSTVWRLNRESNYQHPTQKPVALITKAIMNSSRKGGTVADLFLGSGSTLIACDITERQAIGMEIDPHYVDLICKRYAEFREKNGIAWWIKKNGKDCDEYGR